MAKKSTAYKGAIASPMMDKNWQCEDDTRTLNRAAEVIADTARLKAAMAMMKQTQKGVDTMIDVLSVARKGRKSSHKGY